MCTELQPQERKVNEGKDWTWREEKSWKSDIYLDANKLILVSFACSVIRLQFLCFFVLLMTLRK